MPNCRFQFPEENALTIMGQADCLYKALVRLEDHQSAGETQMELIKRRWGLPLEPPDSARRASFAARAQFDQLEALRRDVDDLLSDATVVDGSEATERPLIMATPPPDSELPPPLAMRQLERWYAKGLSHYLREAARSAKRLLELVPETDHEQTAILRNGLRGLVANIGNVPT
jgi:hypothetical protein